MEERRIIAVDFDGTLCTDRYPQIGAPNFGLIGWLREFQRKGGLLVLWTCRCGEELDQAVDWCRKRGLIFDKINENTDEILEKYGSDSRKIYADIYIDDRSYFPVEGNQNTKASRYLG